MATIIATVEVTLTHKIMFDKAQFTLSATKEHKTPAISSECVCVILITFKKNNYSFLSVLSIRAHNDGYKPEASCFGM